MSKSKTYIRPGMNIICVVDLYEQKRETDVRKSQVYEHNDEAMIISQTTPPILPSFKGRRIAVTYLNTENRVRLSVSGAISQIVNDYELSSSDRVGAVFLSDLSEEREHNLRSAYRVRPPKSYKLVMFNRHKETLAIVDISATGVRFAHDMTRKYKIGQEIKLYLGHDNAFYELKGQIVRKMRGKYKKIEQVAVKFIDVDYRVEDELYSIIRNIERRNDLNVLN